MNNYLYKYFKCSDRSIRMLRESRLFFADPDSLNDLFEFKIQMNPTINTIEEIYFTTRKLIEDQEFKTKAKKEMGDSAIKLIENADIEYFKKNLSIQETEKSLSENWNQIRKLDAKELGVCCFTKRPDNKLMWAHYADDNKGFCLEFEFVSWLVKCKPVNYVKEYPTIRALDVMVKPTLYLDLLFTKSDEWNYEEEFRALKYGTGEIKYPSGALLSVIFGYKTSKENRARIIQSLSSKSCIKLKEVTMNEGSLDLGIKILSATEVQSIVDI